MPDNTSGPSKVAKILFIVGGVLLFVLLAVFIIRLVPVAISNISNLGSSFGTNLRGIFGGERIAVSTDAENVTNGTPIVVSFEYEAEKPGQYYVSYNCAEGLFFDIQSSNGPKRIVCNTPFRLGENLSAISLVPVVTKPNTFFDVAITIEYKDAEGNPIAKGTAAVTVTNESGVATSATSTPADNPYAATGTSTRPTVTATPVPSRPTTTTNSNTNTGSTQTGGTSYTGTSYYAPRSVDLAVTQISKIGNQPAFSFQVYNFGNTPSGTWYFTYTDAENPSRTIVSPAQGSLAGGQGMEVTVAFSGQRSSNQQISVHVDPYGYISESNESNNKATVTITGDRSSGGSSNNGSYDENNDADLVITALEVGRLSGSRFVEEDEIDEDDTAAVRFVVKNQGGESTGSWRFEITNLPYDSSDTYRSKSYSSLKPGQSMEIVADFDGIDDGRYNIRVEVDSDDDVDEESERNNTESETLEVNR